MPLPFDLASGSRVPTVDDFARLLRSLLPDGFTQEDDDPFFYELEAWAVGLQFLDERRRALLANMFRSSTVEMLDEWENEYGLVDDAARGIAERQARLVAAELAHGGTQPDRLATTLAQIDAGITVRAPTRAEIDADSLSGSGELIFQLATLVSEGTWGSRDKRKALSRVLERIVPARCFGQDTLLSMEATLSTAEATWSGAGILGRTHLRFDDTETPTIEAPAKRVRQFGPGSVMRAADVHALQDNVLRVPSRGASGSPTSLTFPTLTAGDERIAFGFDVPALTTIQLSAEDWRKRFMWVCTKTTMGTDVRPGNIGDDTFNSGAQYARLDFNGPGWNVGGATGLRSRLTSNVELYARDDNGHLYLHNAHATLHAYVCGFIDRTAPHDDATGTGMRLVTCADGDDLATANVDAALYAPLARRALMAPLTVATYSNTWTHEGDGGQNVAAYLVSLTETSIRLLDDTIDWRDRLVYVTALAVDPELWGLDPASGGPLGAWEDYDAGPDALSPSRLTAPWHSADPSGTVGVLGYTRQGLVNGNVGNAAKTIEIGSELRVWVDSATGALMLTRDFAATYHDAATLLILVEGSFATGQRSTPAVWPTLAAVDGDPIKPVQLNSLQDRSLLGVARSAAGVEDHGSHPLGKHHVAGSTRPLMPELLTHHGTRTPQGRGCAGWVRRLFATTLAATSELVIDDTIDWRDRMVRARVSRSATYDILPGHADELHANDGTAPVFQTCTARYTGPGGKADTDLDRGFHVALLADTAVAADGVCLYARTTDGALVLRNGTGLTTHVHGFIDATFQLGLSS